MYAVSCSIQRDSVNSCAASACEQKCTSSDSHRVCLQLGRPTDGSKFLILCDSQDVRLSFSPLSDKTDCWHRCTTFDIVDTDTKAWVDQITQDVKKEIEDRVRLLWYDCDHRLKY